MHSTSQRIQNTFGFFTTCAFSLAAFIAFLSVLPFPAPTGSPRAHISVRNVQVVKGRPHYYSPKREEYAQIRFDLDADLSPLFTWNTKQLFVYVTANYPPTTTSDGEMSEAVIWDTIIPASTTPFSYHALKAKYLPDKKTTKKSRSTKSKDTKKEQTKPGVIKLTNQRPKYQLTDPGGVMSQRTNATLTVNWNLQPWVGALIWDNSFLGNRVGRWQAGDSSGGRSKPFDFPPLKGSVPAEAVKDGEAARSGTPKAAEAKPLISP